MTDWSRQSSSEQTMDVTYHSAEDGSRGDGWLTTDHAASSNGMPVLVTGVEGEVLDPAEVGMVYATYVPESEEELSLLRRAARAGYPAVRGGENGEIIRAV